MLIKLFEKVLKYKTLTLIRLKVYLNRVGSSIFDINK